VLKTRGSGNRLVALDPLNPALMRDPYKDKNGRTRYDYSEPSGLKKYTEDDVWHIKGFGADGLKGLSPVGMGWRSMMGAANIAQAGSTMFGGNMRPSGVVSIPDILDPDQRKQMQEVIANGIFGNSEMGRTYMLEGGAKYEQLTINPIDAQMIEQMNASVEDLCRWFQVPPSMVGHGTAVSNWGTGREQINLSFKQYVLDPITTRIEQSIEKHLLTPAERLKYYAEHSFEGMLRADSAGRAAFYSTMVQNGIYTRRHCRKLENLPPIDGDDELTVQSNLIPVKLLGKITATTQPAPAKTE
jgi:HK97 family phage portal protein